MTLLDFYGGETQDPTLFWGGGTATVQSGRGGAGTAWAAPNSNTCFRRFTASSHVFIGHAMSCSLLDTQYRTYFSVYGDNATTPHLTVGMSSSTLVLWRGGLNGTVLASYSPGFLVNTFYYVELEATVADTGGIAKVRLNGAEVINYSGDTKNAGTNTTLDTLLIGANGGVAAIFDDLYICNDAGAAPWNTYLGDVRVGALRPSAVGNSTQFTPDTGSNYARVNEVPYSAANYVSSGTSGNKDTYTLGDLASTSVSVLGVKPVAIAKNPDGGSVSLKTVVRTGGTDYLGSAVVLGASDGRVETVYQTNPGTSAQWTPTEVNALEAGMQRV